ncbi:hypothetical protein OS493_035617 [Desmophyllum pertusum]|uniref:Uncharacterized protein n=1 Tax=Desmophyllum pertusum TaxID=174260 RepID=A0A9W9ZJ22_9CNID|nr:hypothetical protein OS493_035617 [Desmophyllum pertusum]
MEDVAVYFDKEMDLTINTSTCQMVCSGNHWYRGYIETRAFQPVSVMHDEVCTIDFTSSIFIGQMCAFTLVGQRALSLVSRHGNIEINSPLNISGSALSLGSSVQKSIGGYVKTSEDGRDAGPQSSPTVADQLTCMDGILRRCSEEVCVYLPTRIPNKCRRRRSNRADSKERSNCRSRCHLSGRFLRY